jgi:aryl-alcohol dehydrogenase-like predicted oxidoreductase
MGTANFAAPTPEDESIRMISRAMDAGINFFDSGNNYADGESERIIGRAFKQNGLRHQAIITTKVHYPMGPGPNDQGNTRLHILQACEDSLQRLQTDYIDLYQMHRPSPSIPIDETLGALTDLVRQGKVRYIGCSVHPAWQIMEALMVSELKGFSRYISEQPPYNLLDRRIENELVPMCQAYDLAIIPWSPMAMGLLAGRYQDAKDPPQDSRAALRGGIYAERVTQRGIEVGNEFVRLAGQHGKSAAQLAILWVKDQPGITAPVVGPKNVKQLEHLLPVMEMDLEDSVREACDALVPPGTAVANFHNSALWMKMKVQ